MRPEQPAARIQQLESFPSVILFVFGALSARMMSLSQAGPHGPQRLRLGIEAGATHTVAILANDQDQVMARLESGPANVRLLTDQALRRHLREIARELPRPSGLAIGMAGARTTADR